MAVFRAPIISFCMHNKRRSKSVLPTSKPCDTKCDSVLVVYVCDTASKQSHNRYKDCKCDDKNQKILEDKEYVLLSFTHIIANFSCSCLCKKNKSKT